MAQQPQAVSAPPPGDINSAVLALQSAFDKGADADTLAKMAASLGVNFADPASIANIVSYRDAGGKGASIIKGLLPEDTAVAATPQPTEQTPGGVAAINKFLDYYQNEPVGLDPEFLRKFGAMPGEFAGPGGILGAVNYAALAPLNIGRAGLELLTEAFPQAAATGVGQGLANTDIGGVSALQRLGNLFNPNVIATPQNFARDVTDFANMATLYAGATPGLPARGIAPVNEARVATELKRPAKPSVVAPEIPATPVAEPVVVPRPAVEPLPEIKTAPSPELPPVELPTPVKQPAPGIPVTEQNVAAATKTLERAAEELPAEAPLVDKAGNINLSKIETSDDAKKLIDIVAETNGQFLAARRGVMPVEEANRLADKVDLEDILGRKVGESFNAEQIIAARRAVAATAEDVFNIAREYAATGDQNLRTKALESVMRQAAFQEHLSGATAEIGRAMRMLREVQGSDRSRAVEKLIGDFTDITDPVKIDDLLTKIGTLNSPEAVAKFVGESIKPGFSDKVTELWINGLLAGPTTHAVNVTSNALFSAMSIPEKALASGIGKILRSSDRITSGEVGARVVGMVQGAKDGLHLFKEAIRTGEAASGVSAVERQRKAISGIKGNVVRMPSRFLTAEDELFKAVNSRGELAAQAYAKAAAEAGSDTTKRSELYSQYLTNPTKEMRTAAGKHAEVMTFQNELGKYGKAAQQFTRTVWPAQFIVPFLRTPVNILKQALTRTPLAPLANSFWRDIKAGGRVRDEALARLTLGSAIAGSIVAMAKAGVVTGNGPSDPVQRAALLATGWQPQSFKINGKYYQYGRLEPVAMQIGLAADFATQGEFMDKKEAQNAATAITLSIAKNLASKTYLQGISDMMEVFSDPDRYGERYVMRMASSFVPNVLTQTASSIDPVLRDTSADTFAGQLINTAKAKVPGLSDNIPSRLDPWGDRITRTGFASPKESGALGVAYNLLSPVRVSEENKSSPAKTEAAKIMYTAGKPEKKVTINGQSYDIPEQLHRQFSYASGALAKQTLDRIVKQPGYLSLDTEAKRKVFRQVFEQARDVYRDAVKYEVYQQAQAAGLEQ